MVNVLKLTLEWTQGEVIVNSGIGSHTPYFSLDSASAHFISRLSRFSYFCKDDKWDRLGSPGILTQSTYIYRVQSSVWRLPNYWPPPSPPGERRGEDTLAERWRGGESIFRKMPDNELASYSIIPLRILTTSELHRPKSKGRHLLHVFGYVHTLSAR